METELIPPTITTLNNLPEGWVIKTFGQFVTSSQYGITQVSVEDGQVPMFKMNNFSGGRMNPEGVDRINIGDQEFKRYKLVKGDILFNRTNSYELVGKTGLFDLEGDYTFASYLIRFKIDLAQALPEFINYFFNWPESQKRLKTFATKGVSQSNINPTTLQRYFTIPLPPLAEQQRIAAILNKWDEGIGKLQTLIARKKDRKKALMQQLLTGQRRFKEFEGQEWETVKLGEVCSRILNGGTPSTKIPEYWQGTIPWITGADFAGQKVGVIRRYISQEAVRSSASNVITKGDLIVVTRTGVGKLAIAPFDVAISQDITGLTLKRERICTEYLFYFLDNHATEFIKQNQGTSIAGITRDVLIDTKIALPSLPEQRRIEAVLSAADSEIEGLTNELKTLQKQKQGLMQGLLTGKISVKHIIQL